MLGPLCGEGQECWGVNSPRSNLQPMVYRSSFKCSLVSSPLEEINLACTLWRLPVVPWGVKPLLPKKVTYLLLPHLLASVPCLSHFPLLYQCYLGHFPNKLVKSYSQSLILGKPNPKPGLISMPVAKQRSKTVPYQFWLQVMSRTQQLWKNMAGANPFMLQHFYQA